MLILENVTTANNENELCFDRVKRGWEDVAGKEESTDGRTELGEFVVV